MLSQAVTDEIATRNVAKHLRLPTARQGRRRAWSSEDARRFLESAMRDADALYAAYVLVLVLGLRKGEMLGLTDDAVNWAGWYQRCSAHGAEFCFECVGDYDITLQVDRQLQRVGKELLHRETKTPNSDAGLPLPPICAVALRQRQLNVEHDREDAGRLCTDCGCCSRRATELRSSRATSTGTGTGGARRQGCPRSPSGTPAGRVERYLPTLMCIRASRCRSCGTHGSRSRWRSTRSFRQGRLGTR
jgi:hypothetical protein